MEFKITVASDRLLELFYTNCDDLLNVRITRQIASEQLGVSSQQISKCCAYMEDKGYIVDRGTDENVLVFKLTFKAIEKWEAE